MASSSIPALKKSLRALLAARTALSDVQVVYGAPLPNPAREFIWLGDVTGSQDWATIGHTRVEDYDLDVLVSVAREGTDQQAATERAFELASEIELALRADQTVSGAVTVASFGGNVNLTELASTDGMSRGAHLTVQVHCMNYI